MNKLPRIINLLMVAGMVTACYNEKHPPVVLNLDLSDAVLVFNGNDCTGLTKKEDGKTLNHEGLEPADFRLYKTNSKGITSRVHFKTKRSDDDEYYYNNNFFTIMADISEEYFFVDLGRWEGNNKYFINKSSGDAFKFPDDYCFSFDYYEWANTLSSRYTFPQDKYGNIYGVVYSKKEDADVIAKFSVDKNGVNIEKITNIDHLSTNLFAVDIDGNIIFKSDSNKCYYRTVDGELIEEPYNSNWFWTNYDGKIYTFIDKCVKRIDFNKDTKEFSATTIKTYESLSSTDFSNDRILFLDELEEVYLAKYSDENDLYLYSLKADNLEEPFIFSASERGVMGSNKHVGSIYSSGEYIVEFGTSINVFDVAHNMELTTKYLNVTCNDGVRMLNDNKMSVFYWNKDSEVNHPKGFGGVYMSMGIYDLTTGELTEQDTFITGNADRSHVIHIKR